MIRSLYIYIQIDRCKNTGARYLAGSSHCFATQRPLLGRGICISHHNWYPFRGWFLGMRHIAAPQSFVAYQSSRIPKDPKGSQRKLAYETQWRTNRSNPRADWTHADSRLRTGEVKPVTILTLIQPCCSGCHLDVDSLGIVL